MTTPEMEAALARLFNPRQNLIVPNVSWGMFNHECDLIVVSAAGLIREIEIKVSKSDLIKDAEKWHGHRDNMISRLYFAIPKKLEKHIEYIPNHAGIIVVQARTIWNEETGYRLATIHDVHPWTTDIIKTTKRLGNYHISLDERIALMRLSNLRIWGLKEKILKLKKEKAA